MAFVNIDIQTSLNSIGIGGSGRTPYFAVTGWSFPSLEEGSILDDVNPSLFCGIPFDIVVTKGEADNMELSGQQIKIGMNMVSSIHFLGASTNGDYTEKLAVHFGGNDVLHHSLSLSSWVSQPIYGECIARSWSYAFSGDGQVIPDTQPKMFVQSINFDDPLRIDSIRFPDNPMMHIFGMTIQIND